MKTTIKDLLNLLGDLTNPATDAAVAAFILSLGVNLDATALAGTLAGIGLTSSSARTLVTRKQSKP